MPETRENARQASEKAGEGVRAATENVERTMELGREGVQRATEQFVRAFGFAGKEADTLTHQATENLGAVAETSALLARGFQDVSREWLTLSQRCFQKNVEGLTRLSQCRSVQDVIALQSELVRDNWQQFVETNRRIAERSLQAANEANQKITSQTKRAAEQMRRAA